MGVGFKIGGSATFKSFIVVTANAGESITVKHSTEPSITETKVATLGAASFTVKKKGTYNITSTDGSTASVEVTRTGQDYPVTCAWSSTITVTANSNMGVKAKLGSYEVTGTTASSGTTNTATLTVHKSGTYTVTSNDGASTTANASTNGGNVNAEVILLSYIAVTGNAGFTVTATHQTTTFYSVSGTLDSSGKVTLSVRKLGNYTVTSADGSSGTINVASDGGTYSLTVKWTSTVTVQANPSAVVTLTKNNNSNIKYSATANSSTGVASITVLCSGTYNITSNNGGSFGVEGNNASVAVTGSTASARFVKINIPGSLAVGNYSTNVLTAYWTRPSSNWTGCNVRYNSGSTAPANRSSGTNLATGAGNSIALTTTSVNGYNTGTLSASTTYSFAIFSYITINGTSYWCATSRTASKATASYTGTVVTVTSTQKWTVPTGWRTAQAFVVGGGGGGSSNCGSPAYGGGGGGGGRTATSGNISVTPGAQVQCTIGGGGAGKSGLRQNGAGGGSTSFGSYVSASGGDGGYNEGTGWMHGGNGGSGGGGHDGGYNNAGSGGYDGGNGGSSSRSGGGTGQGTTTRAFGANNGTLYAGGGGGGAYSSSSGGSGGSGGGGKGGSSGNGTAGTANTGGGGGGAGGNSSYLGGNGGSGVILIKCVA